MILGLGLSDEAEELREFFRSHEPSEQRRLIQLFAEMMLLPEPLQERDFSDKSPDGNLRVSPSEALEASNGL